MIALRFALLFAMMLSVCAFAQYRKITLIESFSNFGCDYCPDVDVKVQAVMKKHFGQAVQVRYQVDWPSASDPMNKFAKADVQSRVTYYKVDGTPTVMTDGGSGTPNHAKIANKQGYTAPIKIDIQTNPIADDNVLSGNVVITAGQEKTGSHVLHIAMIERAIIFTQAPGSNGEKEFYDVLRKLVTGTGKTIGNISAGSSSPYAFTWTVDVAKVKKEQLAVVAWVQDGSTKAILNAGSSIPTYFIDAQITEQSTSVRNSYTHYIKCSIKNDNQTKVTTKITIRDSTRNTTYTDTRLGWIPSDGPSGDPVPVDSIITSINAGDSLVFWAVTATPATTGTKAVLELFAENRSDPQALGWGCVRYLNLATSASGKEFPAPPPATALSSRTRDERSAPAATIRGNILEYSLPANGHAAISLHTLNGAVAIALPLYSGMQRQGTHAIDLRYSKLKSGMYVMRCSFDGKVINRKVTCLK